MDVKIYFIKFLKISLSSSILELLKYANNLVKGSNQSIDK